MAQSTRRSYEAICDASPDAILLVDGDGCITYANTRVRDMFGYDPDELVGEPVEVLVPDHVHDGHVAQRDAYLEDPETRPMGAGLDLEARRRDGTTFPVDVSLSPVADDGPAVVMAAVRDVSDHTALRAKYQTILAAVPDPVVIADATTGEIVETNEQVSTLLGVDADDLIGEPQTALHPSGEEQRYRELFDRHTAGSRAIYTQFPDGSDIHVETADGEAVPVEINARVFALDDRRLVAGVFRDISPRKRRASQLRELHAVTRRLVDTDERTAVASLVADAADTILEYSRTVVRFVDDGSFHPVAATDQARDAMGSRPDYPHDADTPVGRVHECGEPLCFDDVREWDDGYDRGAARSAMYLPIGEYGVLSVVDPEVGAFDRSDIELASILAANAETALDRLAYEDELERRNERLDEFASAVSHDLRNPLSVASGWLDVVRDDCSVAPEGVDRIEGALDRMEAIVDDTLTLARQGRTVADPEPVDVVRLAEECWSVVSTADARLETDGEVWVRGDRTRVRNVLENLFRNSVEHGSTGSRPGADDTTAHGTTGNGSRPDDDERGPARGRPGDEASDTGEAAVTVTVGPLEDGFYVADDGPGIPADERESVFDPGVTSAHDGTGLGLTIVREVARAHDWQVRVTDGPDGGACFEFTDVTAARPE